MSQPPQVINLQTGSVAATFSDEALADNSIIPGMLVIETSTGVDFHNADGQNSQGLFADVNLITAGTIDTPYVAGETTRYCAFGRGHKVNALVAAGATAIAKGDAVVSAGDGTLRLITADPATADTERNSIVGYALNALDNSAGAELARLQIRTA